MRGILDCALAQRLKDLNPDSILRRGYSITLKTETSEVVTDQAQVTAHERLTIKLHKGELGVTVNSE